MLSLPTTAHRHQRQGRLWKGEHLDLFPLYASRRLKRRCYGLQTALLLALLGEIECVSGVVALPKSGNFLPSGLTMNVAYCGQTPFLQQKSIKDNITFGAPWDEERYEEVIAACALTHDLNILEDGDLTEIGVKGVVLSGGQKARGAFVSFSCSNIGRECELTRCCFVSSCSCSSRLLASQGPAARRSPGCR